MRKLRITLAAVLMALVVLATWTPARAQNPGKQSFTFSQTIYDSCTGEDIAFTFTETFDAHFHMDASGGSHSTLYDTFKGSGVGLTSGTQYHISEVYVSQENDNANNSQFEFIIIDKAGLISQGSLPNEQIIGSVHVTVDANGNVTSVNNSKFSINCRG